MERNEIALRIFIERSDMYGGAVLEPDNMDRMVREAFALADVFAAELKRREPVVRKFDMAHAVELPQKEEPKPHVDLGKPSGDTGVQTTFTARPAEVKNPTGTSHVPVEPVRPIPDLSHGDQGKKEVGSLPSGEPFGSPDSSEGVQNTQAKDQKHEMKGVSAIALAVKRIFRQQKAQAARDRVKFGDWNWKLAEALEDAVAELYLAAARTAKMKAEHAGDFAALARIRAVEVAREVNAVTGQWLSEGRDPGEAFGDSRVVRIASTEAVFARSAGILQVAGGKGKRVVWRNRRSPCDACRRWNGRRVKAGKAFGVVDGVMIFHPPLHPNCFCVLEVE